MSKTVKIAMIGTGDISGIYLKNITETFHEIELTGVCDLVREKAEAAAKKWNVPRIYKDMYEAFDDPQVDIILNLTRPDEHYGVTKPALLAGKHVYSEKPLAATFELGQELVQIAKEKGLFLGARRIRSWAQGSRPAASSSTTASSATRWARRPS